MAFSPIGIGQVGTYASFNNSCAACRLPYNQAEEEEQRERASVKAELFKGLQCHVSDSGLFCSVSLFGFSISSSIQGHIRCFI